MSLALAPGRPPILASAITCDRPVSLAGCGGTVVVLRNGSSAWDLLRRERWAQPPDGECAASYRGEVASVPPGCRGRHHWRFSDLRSRVLLEPSEIDLFDPVWGARRATVALASSEGRQDPSYQRRRRGHPQMSPAMMASATPGLCEQT